MGGCKGFRCEHKKNKNCVQSVWILAALQNEQQPARCGQSTAGTGYELDAIKVIIGCKVSGGATVF